jgi:hypothetical protein
MHYAIQDFVHKTLGTRSVLTCGHALQDFMHNDLIHCENFNWGLRASPCGHILPRPPIELMDENILDQRLNVLYLDVQIKYHDDRYPRWKLRIA